MKYEIVKIPAAEYNRVYCGPRGGYIRNACYAIREIGKGLVSLDGKRPYILAGPSGLNAMKSIIASGGFIGQVAYI